LAKTITGWKDLPPDSEKRLDALTAAIVNKLLHQPTSVLKRGGQGGRVDLYVDALRNLFDLATEAPQEEELGDLEE
jgi:glutamyl-tRNA reductase